MQVVKHFNFFVKKWNILIVSMIDIEEMIERERQEYEQIDGGITGGE